MSLHAANRFNHHVPGAARKRLPKSQIFLTHKPLLERTGVFSFGSPIANPIIAIAVSPVPMGNCVPKSANFVIAQGFAYPFQRGIWACTSSDSINHSVAQVHKRDVELHDHLSPDDFRRRSRGGRNSIHEHLKRHQLIFALAQGNQVLSKGATDFFDSEGYTIPMQCTRHCVRVRFVNTKIVSQLRRVPTQLLVKVRKWIRHASIVAGLKSALAVDTLRSQQVSPTE